MIALGASFGSIRARLTLWNILVLSLLLSCLGLAIRQTLKANLLKREDAGLSLRGRNLIHQLPALSGPERLVFLRQLRDARIDSSENSGDDDSSVDIDPDAAAHPNPKFRPADVPSAYEPPLLRPVRGAAVPAPGEDPPAKRYPVRLLRPDGSLLLSGLPLQAYDKTALTSAIGRGRDTFSTTRYGSDTIRVYTMPLRKDDGGDAAMQLAVSEAPVQRQIAELTETLLLLIPGALVLSGTGAAFLSDRALRPVKAIQSAAAAIGGRGDLSSRLPVRANGRDEISALELTINGMLERIESSFLQQQRFTADASHELRTPLAIAKTGIDVALLSNDRTPEEYRLALTGVGVSLDRMSRMVDDLLLLARADAGRLTTESDVVEIITLFRDTVERVVLFFSDDGSSGPILDVAGVDPPGLAVRGDRDSIGRLLRNLLENAARYTPVGGTVRLTATAVDSGKVRIDVEDTGCGIGAEHVAHVTERFYRADAGRARGAGGSGLGLALCREIAVAHGGELTIESKIGEGTRVSVRLPRAPGCLDNG